MDGDKSSKFFHMSLTIRRRRNRIQIVKRSHEWLYNNDEISDYFAENFSELYRSSYPVLTEEIDEISEKVITKHENAQIMRIPSAEEVKSCVNKRHPLKSLGLDGFSQSFFRNYWETVGPRVVKFVQECFRLKFMPHNINKTFLILIPKKN